MRHRELPILTCAGLLAVHQGIGAAQNAPAGADIRLAHPGLLFNPQSRCPELREAAVADAGAAVVLFLVGPTGVPSQTSIKSSSGSEGLDKAAVACVLKLKFQPATSLGEGAAVASWQEIAWRWATPPGQHAGQHDDAAAREGSASGGASANLQAGQNPPAQQGVPASEASHRSVGSRASDGRAEVRVCVDETGKLVQEPAIVHSSGNAAFDDAAVRIARSGSGYYRPPTTDGKAASGCLHLAIHAEQK